MSRKSIPLTQARLKELLHYAPETGVFTRRVNAGPAKAGDVTGCVSEALGYVLISVDNVRYYGHRLAWLYMTGAWPVPTCDHEDLDGSNNRWKNLREATRGQNQHNRPASKNNRSGLKGAHWSKVAGRYSSSIMVDREKHHLGWFDTAEEAHAAYAAAAARLHGAFARAV